MEASKTAECNASPQYYLYGLHKHGLPKMGSTNTTLCGQLSKGAHRIAQERASQYTVLLSHVFIFSHCTHTFWHWFYALFLLLKRMVKILVIYSITIIHIFLSIYEGN